METMSQRYRTVKIGTRGGTFYYEDTETGVRKSLFTKDEEEAERLVQAKNEALKNPHINRKIGMAYLSAVDPKLVMRTWKDVMADIVLDKTGATLHRWNTAIKDPAFDHICDKVVVMTIADDFLAVLRAGTVSTNVYLRRMQNHCLDLGWLPMHVLPKKKFPKITHKARRGITSEEHAQIIAREGNPERRDFYELCWYFGGSQSDIAALQGEDIDYARRGFVYNRKKTGNMGGMRIGAKAWEVILRRPRTGPLFPYLITVDCKDRATEFKQRCEGLGFLDITLHCYRYGWAERSADAGYPERYAQRVLGQNSKAVHRAYAKKARKQLPSLEEYEAASHACIRRIRNFQNFDCSVERGRSVFENHLEE
jgi:integrase